MDRETIKLFFPIAFLMVSLISLTSCGITLLIVKLTNKLNWKWWKTLIPFYFVVLIVYLIYHMNCFVAFLEYLGYPR